MSALKSIHDVEPLERGGVVARQGFDFQDHVAAAFCLRMLREDALEEVWCETHDDITLLWNDGGTKRVEFVQVKNNQHNQLWSIALLCEREKDENGPKRCILEKSLDNDRIIEPCDFRIVTSLGVKKELDPLRLPIGHLERTTANANFKALTDEVMTTKRCGASQSPAKHDAAFWLARTFWDVRGTNHDLKAANMCLLDEILAAQGVTLALDQRAEIYAGILGRVFEAGKADWMPEADFKKLRQSTLREWVNNKIKKTKANPTSTAAVILKEKFTKASLSSDYLATAKQLRRSYKNASLDSHYLALSSADIGRITDHVASILLDLLVKMDLGQLSPGPEFHAHCREKLQQLRDDWQPAPAPPIPILEGCMYHLASRCRHRFHKEQP